jgi:queuine/archaeosine tRNA-ribosyltransferase
MDSMDKQLDNNKSNSSDDAASQFPPSKKLKLNTEDVAVLCKATEVDNHNNNNHQQQQQQSNQKYLEIPQEINAVDFTQRISWGKFQPYSSIPAPIIPVGAEPKYDMKSSPALCHHINAICGRARACTIHVKQQLPQQQSSAVPNRPITTPMFMPVGTKGCLKALTFQELISDPALQCPIILANTYHLAIQPGTELINKMGGLHNFQGLPKLFHTITSSVSHNVTTPCNGETDNQILPYNLLTDSGGFQMVSLAKLSEVTEDGVLFENPYNQQQQQQPQIDDTDATVVTKDMMLLRPEDSIRHQNNIGANIIMALDDVISSVSPDDERFRIATYRTLRWYDRCYDAHSKKQTQNLFPIVQGGLDVSIGGLREQCLAGFRHREQELEYITPGYAIGGLAGGEEKEQFWKVIDQCCRALPDDKPRYLMGYVA